MTKLIVVKLINVVIAIRYNIAKIKLFDMSKITAKKKLVEQSKNIRNKLSYVEYIKKYKTCSIAKIIVENSMDMLYLYLLSKYSAIKINPDSNKPCTITSIKIADEIEKRISIKKCFI